LVSTLDTFLACNRNAAVTARALYVHYNTIAHRLERIEEVIGPFVDNADRCLSLHLALRIERILRR
jgi:purine catabolism regulator